MHATADVPKITRKLLKLWKHKILVAFLGAHRLHPV